MAKKSIDADRLIEYLEKEADKEFKETEENANSPVLCHFHNGCRMQALDTIDFIKELQQEQTCDTCTNDKGCVTCKDGELWEGKEQPSSNVEESAETSYDTQQYTPRPSVDIGDVARVQFAAHAKVFDKKRKAVFDWEQFKEVVGIFYGFGKKDSLKTEEKEQPSEDLRQMLNHIWKCRGKGDPSQLVLFSYDEVGSLMRTGATWQKQQMPMPEDTVLFNKGVTEGRRLERQDMLKDAVEGIARPDDCEIWVNLVDYGYKFYDGEKVKVVVMPIKEDEK